MGLWKKIFSNDSKQSLEDIEEKLLASDFGGSSTLSILSRLENGEKSEDLIASLKEILREGIRETHIRLSEKNLNVFLIMGVNGVGKTTSISKLAKYFMDKEGLSTNDILFGAADTFRDAAIDQLKYWANKLNIKTIAQQQGSSPSAVVFDSLESAISSKKKLLIIDTAGRLHTKENLLQEFEKIARIIDRFKENIEKHSFLVLDATLGSSSLEQAKEFQSISDIDSLIFTKVDAMPQSGSVYNIGKNLNIPVSFLTYGEREDQIKPFEIEEYLASLF